MSDRPLLVVRHVSKAYALPGSGPRSDGRQIVACDDVSLDVEPGEIVGLVGESGSGKSTLARLSILLERPDAGSITFDGADLTRVAGSELRRRRREFQPIFQDPLSSLNPRWPVGHSISHPLRVHGLVGWPSTSDAVSALLNEVELPPRFAQRYPHELSGGQRQRVCIARALALRPRLIVADEAVSGLDVTIQAQILDLIRRIQAEHGTAFLFISHDLRVVRHLSSRVAVMQAGRIVEFEDVATLYRHPVHPYTQRLLHSVVGPRFETPAAGI
jgi:ABC-type glutathione transport system ATPase component